MRDRRFSEDARRRSPSPRYAAWTGDFDSSRNRNYSPDTRRGAVDVYRSRVGGKSHMMERTDRHSRDFDACGRREYDDRDMGGERDRVRYMVGGRRSRSPRSDHYHGDFDVRSPRENSDLEYRGGERDRYRYPRSPLMTEQKRDRDRDVCLRSVRLLGSDDKNRDAVGLDAGISRKSYDEPHRKDGLDGLLDRYQKYDRVGVRDSGCTDNYGGLAETNMAREGDYSQNSRRLDSSLGGTNMANMSELQYFSSTKPSSLEYEMSETIHFAVNGPADDIPMSKSSSGRGGIHMSSVTSPNLGSFADDKGRYHTRDDFHQEKRDTTYHDREDRYFEKKYSDFYLQDELLWMEKQIGKGIENDEKEHNVQSSRDYFNEDSNYIRSSSHRKDFPSASFSRMREDFLGYNSLGNMTSHSIQTGGYLSSRPVGYASEKEHMISSRNLGVQLDDTKSRSRLYLELPKEKREDLLIPEHGRNKIDRMIQRPNTVKEDCVHHYSPKTKGSYPRFDESSHKRYTRDGLRRISPYSETRLTPEKVGAYASVHARRRDLEMPHDGNSWPNYDSETEQYSGYGNVKPVEHYNRGDGDPWTGGERYDVLQSREYTTSTSRFCDSSRKRFDLADFNVAERSERWTRNKHDKDEMPYDYDGGILISTDENGARKIRRASTDMVNSRPSFSQFVLRRSTNAYKSNYGDIKKRLGSVPKKLHVSQRLKKCKPSAKKRLSAPARSMKHTDLPWLKIMVSNKKSGIKDVIDDSYHHSHDGDQSEVRVTFSKPEPPEGSEEFKQLVQSSFFKFLKQFNEMPMKRKYKDSGKSGSLKCSVCGSDSEEFVDTNGLAKHAFTSEKDGVRSQHLGLHKALCALKGWKIADERCSEWNCELMSDADILAMREDIIIWPPVVIVHNNNAGNNNKADEQEASSFTTNLDMRLRGMGFASILKVCNGKSANQRVMVVKFNGTLSGLQEAMRLHQIYVESNHGRAEFEQCFESNEGSDIGEYGYLGIAQDLDKLDLDITKRCVLKSKKEILNLDVK